MVCIAKTWFNGDVTNAGRTDEQGKIELLRDAVIYVLADFVH